MVIINIFNLLCISDEYTSQFPPARPGLEFQTLHIQDPLLNPHGNATFIKKVYELFPVGAEITELFPSHLELVVKTGYAPVFLPPGPGLKPVPVGRLDDPILHQHTRLQQSGGDPIEQQYLAYLRMMSKEIAYPRYFKARTMFIKRHMSEQEMQGVGQVMQRIVNNNIWFLINSERGAIKNVSAGAMSYVHRDSILNLSVHYEGSDDSDQVKEGMAWLEEFWKTIQFMDGGESYQNYPDLDAKDHLQRYYGSNLNRLKTAKRKWDPKNYFQSPLSIPVN